MAWFKIDDSLHDHPKVRRAGAAAVGVWATAGSFSSAYKTDGFIPSWWVSGWGKTGTTAARKLVAVGLWNETERDGEPGYQFHDWDDYQPTSDEIERDRESARERQRRSRERKSRHAAGDHSMCDRCSAIRADVTRDNHRDVTRDITRESQYPVPTRPVPTRPDKGQGRERDGGGYGIGPSEGADPTPVRTSPKHHLNLVELTEADWRDQHLNGWPLDPQHPEYGGWTDPEGPGWVIPSTPPPHYQPGGDDQ
ncbi:hypothetical protein GCM10009785_00070 [Brooklawnia cerclae]|uniref:Uncharacterized protein n=1 Tax=Brooklawnia cerclae TaxID=349934 RepID=A0ABX0SJB5_9ACTN|nr:hypothetical protein [Brooklawnia cerclae]NIH58488.1 hypothetical protein [Brooklawnia cerclae]